MRHFIYLLLFLAQTAALAEWVSVATENQPVIEQYINLKTVKQTGPMSIYRQVKVLSQGSEIAVNGVVSTLAVHEYDCMRSKVRIFPASGYSGQWANGEEVPVPLQSPNLSEWHALSLHRLGQKTFNLLCPSGSDNSFHK